MRQSIFILLLLSALVSCTTTESKEKIVEEQDLKPILTELRQEKIRNSQENKLREEISFWKAKAEDQKGAFLYTEKMAQLYADLFDATGDVSHILRSNEYLKEVINRTSGNYRAKQLLTLSSNSVKLHQFQDALAYSTEAYHDAHNKYGPALMTFDAAMELGDYDYAGEILTQYRDEKSFDYLVRHAKYLDHKGDLSQAIDNMEEALSLVKNKNKELYLWTLSNLGDMYGHDGQIAKSYNTYMKVLKADPDNLHVLKGVAWIAFVSDQNYDLAKDILTIVSENTHLPDAHLMLAEIAQVEGDPHTAHEYKSKFMDTALRPEYRNLYASYLTELYLEESDFHGDALTIAYDEVLSRPTPEMYSLLAWVYFKKGNLDKAQKIIMENVYGKSYEPNLVYRSGIILAYGSDKKLGRQLLKEAKEASYELGPTITVEIDKALSIL